MMICRKILSGWLFRCFVRRVINYWCVRARQGQIQEATSCWMIPIRFRQKMIAVKKRGGGYVKRRQPCFVATLAGCLVDDAAGDFVMIRLLAAAEEMSAAAAAAWQTQRYIRFTISDRHHHHLLLHLWSNNILKGHDIVRHRCHIILHCAGRWASSWHDTNSK